MPAGARTSSSECRSLLVSGTASVCVCVCGVCVCGVCVCVRVCVKCVCVWSQE